MERTSKHLYFKSKGGDWVHSSMCWCYTRISGIYLFPSQEATEGEYVWMTIKRADKVNTDA
jgi:hypothetical protein